MKLKYIDSIRGVAILMVLLVHISQLVTGLNSITKLLTDYCQMGVQLFFVASAYTLCLSANNRSDESRPMTKYVIRRFFRIAPIYYLGILGYFILALLHLWPNYYTLVNVLANIFFLHGFFPAANNTIVPGGWSIGAEVAFYAIFPLLFYFALKVPKSKPSILILLVFLSIALSQILLFLIFYFTGYRVVNDDFIYYSIVNQFPVFCVGIAYYISEKNAVFRTSLKTDVTAFILLTCLSLGLWTLNSQHLFSIIPITSAISFIFLINIFKKNSALNFNFLSRIGTVSYSMYVIHPVLVYIVCPYILNFLLRNVVNKNILIILLYAVAVCSTFALAIISEKYIEKPFIKLGRRLLAKIT